MPQHNPADDVGSTSDREPRAGELHQARGQPSISTGDGDELPDANGGPAQTPIEAASAPAPCAQPSHCRDGKRETVPRPTDEAFVGSSLGPARPGAITSQPNRHVIRVHSHLREEADVDLLIQAILIIAEDMTTPSDEDEVALI